MVLIFLIARFTDRSRWRMHGLVYIVASAEWRLPVTMNRKLDAFNWFVALTEWQHPTALTFRLLRIFSSLFSSRLRATFCIKVWEVDADAHIEVLETRRSLLRVKSDPKTARIVRHLHAEEEFLKTSSSKMATSLNIKRCCFRLLWLD